ncbi:MAG: hypothetical protein OXD37_00760 [Acidimicrobiaceae bacterium]|nr:hypothetical protein [Acidimicrobiaceae bacterium]
MIDEARPALKRATEHLLDLQTDDGSFEGEVVWCAMLPAQYVLLHHVVGRQLSSVRRRRVLRYFQQSRLPDGLWGLHDHGPANLFVTALVYVAARLLGAAPTDPLIEPARRFLQKENVLTIPSWGKFWLALLNLYSWRGVNPLLPELWLLPRRIPLHPSNWYCHTRLIYMSMAALYGLKFQAPVTPVIREIRQELFPDGFDDADFAGHRNRLRDADLYAKPSRWLNVAYGLARLADRFHSRRLRARCTAMITRRIRWELQSSDHTSISPVSGLLNIAVLWVHDPQDPDGLQALARLDGWIWEDDEAGLRVAGARSGSWDTGFALQALSTAATLDGVAGAAQRAAEYLRAQQIRVSFEGYRDAYRIDPRGGWCFAGGWHGWPVTDCSAEAVLGLLATGREAVDSTALSEAVGFMLRGQNKDGGFGTYERQKSVVGLEWLNPAEMFGDSMTDFSHVECTASCLEALSACRKHYPGVIDAAETAAMARADEWLRDAQRSDGAWRGFWGVNFIYGTYFGIRGVVASGAGLDDPAVRSACQWLLDRQRDDGGWGEHYSGCWTGRYVAHDTSQVIQSAWALLALLGAGHQDWAAIDRGIRFLVDAQQDDGSWPRQDMAGVFFRTALLEYVLYRQYFPLHALGLYGQRRAGS